MAAEKSYLRNLVGVFGFPVAENPTVVMMQAAFDALGLPWQYLTVEVRPENLGAAVAGMRAMGFRGINCTIPHKGAVIAFLDETAPDAKIMGAVNTVYREGNRLIGANTDGKGFLRSLRDDAGFDPAGKSFMILGAGGAARAASVELAMNGASRIRIVNRDESRGRALVKLLLENTRAAAEYVPWTRPVAVPEGTDVLVNATSIGLYPDTSEPSVEYGSIRKGMIVCDVIPNPPRTPFLGKAEARGAVTLDGLGMLVYQGVIAFGLWTGKDAPVDVMKRALIREFGASENRTS